MGTLNFSQRTGITSVNPLPILDSMSLELRVSLFNLFLQTFFPSRSDTAQLYRGSKNFALAADEYFFFRPVIKIEPYHSDYARRILNWVENAEWNRVYEFVEWCLLYLAGPIGEKNPSETNELKHEVNSALELHYSGYRIIGLQLVPLSDAEESLEVEASIKHSGKFLPVSVHIKSAAHLLNPAATPNYRNSVKESISAVEAAAKIVTGQENTTLGAALTWLEKKSGLHGALKTGFSSLYGWTSAADGIRHSLMEEDKLTFEEAKYMLVSCSAFANYLISVYAKSSQS